MYVKGGCCVYRYTGNVYDMSSMDRIMLRFRPIAPKPASDGSGSGSFNAEKDGQYVKSGHGKRKYVGNNNWKKNDSSDGSSTASVTKKCRSKKKLKGSSSEDNESRVSVICGWEKEKEKDKVVTLPLLPETPERDENYLSVKGFLSGVKKVPESGFMNFGSQESWNSGDGFWMSGTVAKPPSVVGSWLHVECITETWVNNGFGYGGNGWANREMLMDLESDTYPGFVSDGLDRVVWVNKAYREMAAGKEEQEVLVRVVIKEGIKLPQKGFFTCRVKVVTCGKEKSSRTLPCDVWRLDGDHGFAWRLDVKAALSLGR